MSFLDDVREKADKQFGDFSFDLTDGTTVVLANPLRLSKEKREELKNTSEAMTAAKEAEDFDALLEALNSQLYAVSKSGRTPINKLIRELDGDLALTLMVVMEWRENTSAGGA